MCAYAGVQVLNEALESFDRGDEFKGCVRTTPTTSATTTLTTTLTSSATTTPTSTTTTTATSTPTTTALYGKADCHSADGMAYLTFEGEDANNCASFAGGVSDMLAKCTELSSSSSSSTLPTLKCRATDASDVAFAIVQDEGTCSDTGTALSILVDEYTRGTEQTELGCAVGGFITFPSADACDAAVLAVNNAFGSFVDGTFDTCHLSTPTTSPTTTATSSQTITGTSSPTTSATTTVTTTTTPTSSHTTTPTTTTTLTSSPSSSATTSQSSTGTTSETSTATTSPSTTVTSSQTSSATTSASTTATTSGSSSQTTTPDNIFDEQRHHNRLVDQDDNRNHHHHANHDGDRNWDDNRYHDTVYDTYLYRDRFRDYNPNDERDELGVNDRNELADYDRHGDHHGNDHVDAKQHRNDDAHLDRDF
eukprot:gene26947-22771_t